MYTYTYYIDILGIQYIFLYMLCLSLSLSLSPLSTDFSLHFFDLRLMPTHTQGFGGSRVGRWAHKTVELIRFRRLNPYSTTSHIGRPQVDWGKHLCRFWRKFGSCTCATARLAKLAQHVQLVSVWSEWGAEGGSEASAKKHVGTPTEFPAKDDALRRIADGRVQYLDSLLLKLCFFFFFFFVFLLYALFCRHVSFRGEITWP